MSDKKLREKADALIAFTQQGPRFIAWVQAVTDALAPEKAAKVCGNCGEKVSSLSDHVTCAETGDYYCQPAPPEPAAREMPEAVEAAIGFFRELEKQFSEPGSGQRYTAMICGQRADALETFWRAHLAQPVAVGMTEELEHVLSIAERDLRYKEECFDNSARTVHDERIERLRAAIAAVRQKAAQPRRMELGKVRAYFNTPFALRTVGDEREALAELDAAEGKERE